MSIAVACPKCRKKLKAPASMAGRRAKCPHCAQVMQLSAPKPKPESSPATVEVFENLSASGPLGLGATSASCVSTVTRAAAPKPAANVSSNTATNATGGSTSGSLFNAAQFDELLADVGTRIDKPQEPKQDRYPCPICHEMIVRGSTKCRFCGEDFQKQFDALLPQKRMSSGSRSHFHACMNILGGIWIAFSAIPLLLFLFVLIVAIASNDSRTGNAVFGIVLFSLPLLFWLGLGIAVCRKAIWAVWVGLVLHYIGLTGSVLVMLLALIRTGNVVSTLIMGVCTVPTILLINLAHRCIYWKNQMG
ncbi:MAG TPA: hypothetical protein VJL29_09930 [Thermoguttaceae bacterium]|nr:hypothetical protein [Thermoguttaceae bacterium]